MTIELEKKRHLTWRLDGRTFNPRKHPHIEYIRSQLSTERDEPLHIRIRGTIPKASGLGSSAALSVAFAVRFNASNEPLNQAQASTISHQAEATAQGGRASPLDTATSSFGGFVVFPIRSKTGLTSLKLAQWMSMVRPCNGIFILSKHQFQKMFRSSLETQAFTVQLQRWLNKLRIDSPTS